MHMIGNNSNKGPLVTAVITTHNRYNLVLQAIHSVQSQTYSNIELIVVDDASNKDIKEKLGEKAQEDGFRYIYIGQEESKGGNHARNIGILNGKGKYIAFLDDDDEWMPEKIEKQVSMLESDNKYKVCHCGRIYDYNFGEHQKFSDVSKLAEGDIHTDILIKTRCVTSAMIVERQLLIDVGMFDENLYYWQEYDLCIRLFQETKLAVVRENLLLYRIIDSDEQRLSNKIDGWEKSAHQIYQKYDDYMATLTRKQLKQRDVFYYQDGVVRCHKVGDFVRQRQYLKEIYRITHSPKDFFKLVFNIYSFRKSDI